MRRYHQDAALLDYASPSIVLTLLGGLALTFAAIFLYVGEQLSAVELSLVQGLGALLTKGGRPMLAVSVAVLLVAILLYFCTPPQRRICRMISRALFHPAYRNPLHFKEGEYLPSIRCSDQGHGIYNLLITTQGVTPDELAKLSPHISASLNRCFKRWAVTGTETDVAGNFVTFRLEDVKADRSLKFHSVEEMRPDCPTHLLVDEVSSIDLTTSGSMVVAGKTRSGKTTGVISLLLQILSAGPDDYGSKVVVVDPKRAELSVLPCAISPDEDGGGRAILDAIRQFAQLATERQKVLNLCAQTDGDALHWWDLGPDRPPMKPCFLFLDEFLALRTLYTKPAKGDDGYNLETFDGLLKSIVSMGASAGCYVIISVAEASVGSGGIPSVVKDAMSTRILFRPTKREGEFLWDGSQLEAFPDRVYAPGEAWFSSTDGKHDTVSFAQFPRLLFKPYKELGRLLEDYHAKATPSQDITPPPGEA